MNLRGNAKSIVIRTMMTKNVNEKVSMKITKKTTRNPWEVVNGVNNKVRGKNGDKRFGATASTPAAVAVAAARATIKTITTKTKKIEYVKAACHRC